MKLVALGGGTGLSVILRGLKEITQDITAVVTVADDGGGSGVLREDLGMLPPGDVRNCILALANKEPILQDLFQYRFEEGRLKGQNFGNLMIAAMLGISDSFESAIQKISDIFAITGKVYPVSQEDIVLYAKLKDGTIVAGESNIPYEVIKRKSSIDRIWIEPEDACSLPQVVQCIGEADVILLGPGSLLTSVIPNLLIKEVCDAINKSSARVYYVSNVMTQPGETDGFTVMNHIEAIFKHTGLEKIDAVVANTGTLDGGEIKRYKNESAIPVVLNAADRAYCKENGIKIIAGDYTDVKKGYIRHNAVAISRDIAKQTEKIYIPKKQYKKI